ISRRSRTERDLWLLKEPLGLRRHAPPPPLPRWALHEEASIYFFFGAAFFGDLAAFFGAFLAFGAFGFFGDLAFFAFDGDLGFDDFGFFVFLAFFAGDAPPAAAGFFVADFLVAFFAGFFFLAPPAADAL